MVFGLVVLIEICVWVVCVSCIFVEGCYDVELVEKVWGIDLWVEGVVVEYLEGIDYFVEVLY